MYTIGAPFACWKKTCSKYIDIYHYEKVMAIFYINNFELVDIPNNCDFFMVGIVRKQIVCSEFKGLFNDINLENILLLKT